jgi:Right handed beta helix region
MGKGQTRSMMKLFCKYGLILFILTVALSFNTTRAQNCQHEFYAGTNLIEGTTILPGDTVCLMGGSWGFIQFKDIKGTQDQPIVIINKSGVVIINTDWFYGIKFNNCAFLKLSGNGQHQLPYGIRIAEVSNDHGAGISIDNLSTNVELAFLEISNVKIGGIYAKSEPDFLNDCTFPAVRDSFTMYNTVIHDCYLHDIGDEGMYIGSSKYTGQTIYHCDDTLVLPHLLKGVKIYNNILDNIGWDGIQVSSADEDCAIYNNTIIRDSYKEEEYQMSGILIGGGSDCDCYNNKIIDGKGDGIDFLGLTGSHIFNNLIVNPGQTFHPGLPAMDYEKHGIWIGELETKVNETISIYNNTIVSPRTFGLKLANQAFQNYLIRNNIIVSPGAFADLGENSYINLLYPTISTTQSNNFTNPDQAMAKFVNPLLRNYDIHYYSPAVNTGYDMGLFDLQTDLEGRPRPFDAQYDIGAYECQDSTLFGIYQQNAEIDYHRITPNPFNQETSLEIYLVKELPIKVELYTNLGVFQEILLNTVAFKGKNQFRLSLTNIASGIYFYKIITEKGSLTGKLIKL